MSTLKEPKISAGPSPELRKNILATVAFYDRLDFPLTAFEVWKHLINSNSQLTTNPEGSRCGGTYGAGNLQPFSLTDVVKKLNEHNLKRFIGEFRGFYFLRGREYLVEQRIKRGKISVAKTKKLRRIVWLLRFVPFVRMVGVTGGLAMKNADEESDWDVLIVLKAGRIWTGRTLVTGLLHFLGKRRHGRKIRDRVCLNHFVTDQSLKIFPPENIRLFSANEYHNLLPLFGSGIFRRFQLANRWIKSYRPNYCLGEAESPLTFKETKLSRFVQTAGEKIFGWDALERWLGKWQKEKITRNPKTHLPGSFIQASDAALIFLPEPKRWNMPTPLNSRKANLMG